MTEERFHELMDEARCLPNTPTCVALLEEAVREADLRTGAGNSPARDGRSQPRP